MMAKVVGLVLLGVMAAALLLIAGEQHYQGCVEARTAVALANGRVADTLQRTGGFDFGDEQARGVTYVPADVQLRGCSRLPF